MQASVSRLAISAQTNVRRADRESYRDGPSQNGQPVEYGEPLFIIG